MTDRTEGKPQAMSQDQTAATGRQARIELFTAMTQSPRDWSLNPHDAKIWQILVGFDPSSFPDVGARHGWSDDERMRLVKLHMAFWKDVKL